MCHFYSKLQTFFGGDIIIFSKHEDSISSLEDSLQSDFSVKTYWKKLMKSWRIGTYQTLERQTWQLYKHGISRELYNKHQLSYNNHRGNNKMNIRTKTEDINHLHTEQNMNSTVVDSYSVYLCQIRKKETRSLSLKKFNMEILLGLHF